MQSVKRSAPPPVFRNQQVVSSSLTAGSIESTTYAPPVAHRHIQGAYRVAYRWLLRLIGRSPVAHLGTPDDLATEQRIADLTRRLRTGGRSNG